MNRIHKKSLFKYCLPLLILLIGFIIFFTDSIEIVSDMGFYMNAGMNLSLNKGYTDADGSPITKRGPVFPLLLAFSFWLFGPSPWSAFWIVRIFAIMNPLVLYFIGKKFYGKWIGFAAAFLSLSSYSLNYASYRHLDAVWPFFVMLSMLILYFAFEKRSYTYFILSAIFMSSAYLTKQAPILLFPAAIIFWILIGDYRDKKNLKGSILFICVVLVLISPWVYHVYSQTQNISYSLLGGLGETAAIENMSPNLFTIANRYFNGLLKYFSYDINSLSYNFSLAPLFILSWLFTFVYAFRKDKPSIILTVFILLLSPFISYVGRNNLRVGQLLIVILLSYLVTARFLLEGLRIILNFFLKKERASKRVYVYGSILLILSFVCLQNLLPHYSDKANKSFLKHSFFVKKAMGIKVRWQIQGLHGELLRRQEVVDWMLANLHPNSQIMCDWNMRGRSLYFYSGGKFPIHDMPIVKIHSVAKSPWLIYGNKKNEISFKIPLRENNEKLLFLSQWNTNLDPRNHFIILVESDLLNSIVKKNIEYIIISERTNFLTKYFSSNSGFVKIADFLGGWIKIYRVKNAVPVSSSRTFITYGASLFLNNLKKHEQERYLWLRKHFFLDILGWEEDELSIIEANN
jgi:4-amino-4-deoxy-L-arabinose transferase-like glycosyltransferase